MFFRCAALESVWIKSVNQACITNLPSWYLIKKWMVTSEYRLEYIVIDTLSYAPHLWGKKRKRKRRNKEEQNQIKFKAKI